jgi:O-antigen/teichoic acid export membrane protein
MALVSPEFVHVFYTDRWSAAIPVMQLLALYTVVYSLAFNAGDVYKATGRPVILNQIAIFRLALTLPMLWFASLHSILAVAAGTLAVNLIVTPVQLFIAGRILKTKMLEILDAIRPAAVGTIVMLLAMIGVSLGIDAWGALPRLLILILVGAAAYTVTMWFTNRAVIDQIVEIGRSIIRKRRAAVNES